MKARPMKEWIFFAFIALGIACSLILPLTVSTYLDFAENGYGLEAEVDDYFIGSNGNMLLNLTLKNPGKLEMQITGIRWNLLGYDELIDGNIPGEIYDIEGEDTEEVTFIFAIQSLDYPDMGLNPNPEKYNMEIEVYIPHRDVYTTLTQSGVMGVV